MPIPVDPTKAGNWGFVALVVLVLVLTTLRPFWRNIVLVPTLYLAVFVWDARLAFEPSITRLILIGVILIVLMNARPQGLLGATRVEIACMAAAPARPARRLEGFGGLACITELDLHVDEGEIVSVIGPNGAGKTTLFNLITGVYAPDAGEIDFAGREPARARAAPDRRARDRPHVPVAAALPEHDREGERDGGRLLAHAGRHLPLDPAHARACAARSARSRSSPRSGSRSSASG